MKMFKLPGRRKAGTFPARNRRPPGNILKMLFDDSKSKSNTFIIWAILKNPKNETAERSGNHLRDVARRAASLSLRHERASGVRATGTVGIVSVQTGLDFATCQNLWGRHYLIVKPKII